MLALHKGLNIGLSHINTYGLLKTHYVQAQPTLHPAPDGFFIVSRIRKPSSNQNTNFVISLPDPASYALLASLDSSIEITQPTLITIRGQRHLHCIHINFIPHTRCLLGRNYHQLLTNPGITALDPHIPPLKFNPAKRLTGKRADKMARACTLNNYPDILNDFEAHLLNMAEDYVNSQPAPPLYVPTKNSLTN